MSRRDWPWLLVAVLFCAGLKTFTWGWKQRKQVEFLGKRIGMIMAALPYRDSEPLQFIRQLPADYPIYTNDQWLVLFWTGRMTKQLPYTAAARDTLGLGMSMSQVKLTGGWCVWFRNGCMDYLPPNSFYAIAARAPGGRIYGNNDSTGVRMLVLPTR